MTRTQLLWWVGSFYNCLGGWGYLVLLETGVFDVAPQVLKGVPGSKPDGCPVSDLDLGPKLKGARLRGRVGLARGAFFLQGATALKSPHFCLRAMKFKAYRLQNGYAS